MALSDLPGVGTFQASKPTILEPLDLQPAIDKMMRAYEEGFISAEDLQKRAMTGPATAKAEKSEAQAREAKAKQDIIEQAGQPAPKKKTTQASATPNLDRALSGDIDFKKWTTADLSKLAGEAGYQILGAAF